MTNGNMSWCYAGSDQVETWPCHVLHRDGCLTVDCDDGFIWRGPAIDGSQFELVRSDGGGRGTFTLNPERDILSGHFQADGYRGEWDIVLEEPVLAS
ncbi:MAG: hypothetical protein U1D69_00425 [Polynucleobacter sp.]|nr:hypothetical protein [Polynucleobacter sp.]